MGAELDSKKCDERLSEIDDISYGNSENSQFFAKENLKKGIKSV
ncbi:MAG: hypothetical protein ACI4J2_05590 [Ruminococcus sp.]